MGKVQILTKEQQIILAEVKKNPFFSGFYFTGGTALSAFYLHHRYSEDLDFFSEKEFDPQEIFTLISGWAGQYHFTFTSEFHEVVYIFLLTFKNKKKLKVDFGYYPYRRIEQATVIDDIKIDSLLDIAINKLLTIIQRSNVKDFVDLYFLLDHFTIWDLIEGVRVKFKMKLDPYIIASDFLKIEDFENMPRMTKPLTLDQLKAFFRRQAQKIGKKITNL